MGPRFLSAGLKAVLLSNGLSVFLHILQRRPQCFFGRQKTQAWEKIEAREHGRAEFLIRKKIQYPVTNTKRFARQN